MTPAEALKKVEDLRLGSLPYEHYISTLAVIALHSGLKPAFMGDEEGCLEDYKEAGKRIALRVLVTNRPPTDIYPIRRPKVPQSFVTAFHSVGQYKDKRAVWLYKGAETPEKISQSVSGQLDEGHVLGYPECCVRAYQEDRAVLVETIYNHIVSHYQAKTEQEAVKVLMTDPPFPPPKIGVRASFERFPYISHIACEDCLSGKSGASSKLNQELRKLAAEVGLKDRIIDKMTDLLASGFGRRT